MGALPPTLRTCTAEHRLDGGDGVDGDLGRGATEGHEGCARHVLGDAPAHTQRLERRHEVRVGNDGDADEGVDEDEDLDADAPPLVLDHVEAQALHVTGEALELRARGYALGHPGEGPRARRALDVGSAPTSGPRSIGGALCW